MSDEGGFDPCECAWGHELAMRRLLSLLRNSQSDCTDAECFQTATREQNVSPDYYIVMTIMVAIYFFLHYWLVQNRRNRVTEPSKPQNRDGSNGNPPTPPPTSS